MRRSPSESGQPDWTIVSAGWFGVPELPALGLDLTPGREFWVLLPSFVSLTLVLGLKTISDLSLRLLRHHASAVRHQKFHGVDIVTVQVDGSA